MTDLKLAQLPARTPIKLSIIVTPELQTDLQSCAAMYATAYGKEEAVAELVAAMLAAFFESDRGRATAWLGGGKDRAGVGNKTRAAHRPYFDRR